MIYIFQTLEIQHQVLDINNSDNYPLKISSGEWLSSQVTGIEFWNGWSPTGGRKTVPTARIISRMADNGGADGEDLLFQTQPSSSTNPNQNQPTTKMIIENDGFVGVGTTNPFSYLHVKGSAHDASGNSIKFYTSSF